MSKVVENVSKKPIPDFVKALVMEMCVNDKNGDDIEVGIRFINGWMYTFWLALDT